ncbi:MAG: hypothetical protein JO341_01645 [Gammaproteobacteria bacterium]|nr:hypothetical protein [Gammaproteobacteria bacterium]
MNKTFFLAWVVIFVAWYLGDFVVHGLLLHADYEQVPQLFRSPDTQMHYLGVMLLAHVLMAGAFVWIYGRGVESKPWLEQGLRFGLAVAVLAVIPTYLIYYAVQPLPTGLVVKQIVYDTVLVLVLGAIVGALYRAPRTV